MTPRLNARKIVKLLEKNRDDAAAHLLATINAIPEADLPAPIAAAQKGYRHAENLLEMALTARSAVEAPQA